MADAPANNYPNGFTAGACPDSKFILYASGGEPGVADVVREENNADDEILHKVYVSEDSAAVAPAASGDACHGGEPPKPFAKCKSDLTLPFGQVAKLTFKFDESEMNKRANACERAVFDFINRGVMDMSMPEPLRFQKGDSNLNNAIRWFAWMGFRGVWDTIRGNTLVGTAQAAVANASYRANGLDAQIKAYAACPKADSIVDDMSGLVTNCDFYEKLSTSLTCLRRRADLTNRAAQWAIVVRDAFVHKWLIEQVVCCSTISCGNQTLTYSGERIVNDVNDQLRRRVITIEGNEYRVIYDRSLPLVANVGSPGNSDTVVMAIPLTITGDDGMSYGVTRQVFPWTGNKGSLTDAINQSYGSGYLVAGNLNQYKISWDRKGSCVEIGVKVRYRTFLDMPDLAYKAVDVLVPTKDCPAI